jgi:hypothetical protein
MTPAQVDEIKRQYGGEYLQVDAVMDAYIELYRDRELLREALRCIRDYELAPKVSRALAHVALLGDNR